MQKQYYLENLGCANCAAKIEAKLSKQPVIKTALIDFVNKKLILHTQEHMEEDELLKRITPIITNIERDVTLVPWDIYKNGTIAAPENSCGCGHSHEHTDDDCCGSHNHSDGHSHQHAHNHSHEHEISDSTRASDTIKIKMKLPFISLIPTLAGTIIGFASLVIFPEGNLGLVGVLVGYLLLSYKVLLTALRNIRHGEIFDENFLMGIATIGALIIGEYPEALAVMLLYQIGEFFQDMAVDKSRKHLAEAMNIKAAYANLITANGIQTIAPEEVNIGDIILVKPSERIPLDGIVTEGTSFIDTSSLTGESVPRKASADDEVLSGCINGSGSIYLRVTKPYKDSTVKKILDLVENASANKSPTENFITKFARVYTPIVVICALLLAILPPIISGTFDFYPWIYKACGFLVVSCPCALVISVPLGFFGGIGCASKNGIIIKGSNYLEALNSVSYAVFDKTGTLTKGSFRVTSIVPANNFSSNELLEHAAAIERFSNHPIAKSIVTAYEGTIDPSLIKNFVEVAGQGVIAEFNEKKILLGNAKLLNENGIAFTIPKATMGSISYLSIDGEYAGYLVVADELKEDSKKTIQDLKDMGIKTIMLTGDTDLSASYVANELKLDSYYSSLLPADKVTKIEEILKSAKPNEKVLFVGDGINDAPVLARADVGAAMGGVGSDAAVEAADVVLMTDEPSKLKHAIHISRFTRKIVSQNIALSLGIKALVLVLVALGFGNMWLAIFADVGVSMIAILNSIRTLKA